jgi:hypothetical protein
VELQGISATTAETGLGVARQEFESTLEALAELLEQISPHVAELDARDLPEAIMAKETPLLSEDAIQNVAEDLKAVGELLEKAATDAGETTQEENGETGPGPATADHGRTSEISRRYRLPVRPDSARILAEMMRALLGPPRLPILHRSLITMVVAAVEVLVAQGVTVYLQLHPGAIGTEAKEFSLADLQAFNTMQDAIEEAVSRKVDGILAGGLEEWSKWFKGEALRIDLSKIALNWDETQEVFQRRHIIMHNGGRVSKRYLQKVPNLPDPAPSLGGVLPVDAAYVRRALDLVLVLGVGFAGMLHLRLFSNSGSVSTQDGPFAFISTLVYRLLVSERWEAAEALCESGDYIGRKRHEPEGGLIRLECHRWLAIKRQRGLGAIADEVASWDTSALAPMFKLIKAALLDKSDEAFRLLPSVIDSGDIDQHYLREWPVLAGLRSDSRMQEFLMGESGPPRNPI